MTSTMRQRSRPRSRSRSRGGRDGARAGRELMAGLGGIAIQGAPHKPFYLFTAVRRACAGIPRCEHCVLLGIRAPCLLEPLTRVRPGVWAASPCHACTTSPALQTCSLAQAFFVVDAEKRRLVPSDESGEPLAPANADAAVSPGTSGPADDPIRATPGRPALTAELLQTLSSPGLAPLAPDSTDGSALSSPVLPATPDAESPPPAPPIVAPDNTKSAPEPAAVVAPVVPYCH